MDANESPASPAVATRGVLPPDGPQPAALGPPALPRERTRAWVAALLVTAIAASGALYVTIPPSPDQWFLGYTGWRVTEGDVPYTDFAAGNWPGSHWLHAFSVLIFGNTIYTWRAFDFSLMLIAVTFAAALARDLWGRAAGVWLLGLYPALYVAMGYWYAGERDFVGAHILFAALWFYWKGLSRRRLSFQVGTGAAIAAASLVKPTFAMFGPLLAAHALAVPASICSLRARACHVTVAGASAALGILVGFGALALEGASFSSFWDLAVRSVVVRYGNDSRTTLDLLGSAAHTAVTLWGWIVAGAAAGLAAQLLRGEPDRRARNLLFPTLFASGLVSYLLQAQGLGYTLTPMYAAAVPMLCSGLALLPHLARSRRPWRVMLAALLMAAPVIGTGKKWSGELGSSIRLLAGRIPAAEHRARYDVGDGISAEQAMELASELRSIVPEGGTVLVWGRANAINFLARRAQPTRFHHNVTIIRPYLPEPFATQWSMAFEQEVTARTPEACLVNAADLRGSASPVAFLREFLASRYVRERQVGNSTLYLRRRAGAW
jgi:hypothetical protein